MADTIYTLIPKIREEVGAVRKDQTAQAGAKYSYRSGDQVINALVPILNKYGVFTTVDDVDHELTMRDVGSKVVTVARLKKKVTFYAPDGSSIASTVAAESSDYSDKATGAAQSYAYRYALLQTFTLPTDEEDPDARYVEKVKDTPAAAPKPDAVTELQGQIKAIIAKGDYTGDAINALGNQISGGKAPAVWMKQTTVLKAILDKVAKGEVA